MLCKRTCWDKTKIFSVSPILHSQKKIYWIPKWSTFCDCVYFPLRQNYFISKIDFFSQFLVIHHFIVRSIFTLISFNLIYWIRNNIRSVVRKQYLFFKRENLISLVNIIDFIIKFISLKHKFNQFSFFHGLCLLKVKKIALKMVGSGKIDVFISFCTILFIFEKFPIISSQSESRFSLNLWVFCRFGKSVTLKIVFWL